MGLDQGLKFWEQRQIHHSMIRHIAHFIVNLLVGPEGSRLFCVLACSCYSYCGHCLHGAVCTDSMEFPLWSRNSPRIDIISVGIFHPAVWVSRGIWSYSVVAGDVHPDDADDDQ